MKKLKSFFVVTVLFLTPVLVASSCESESEVGQSSAETTEQTEPKNSVIIDVRTAGEFKSGAIAGAINIPLDALANRLDLVRDYDEIIVYCQSGARSARATQLLKNAGFVNVIDGGGIQQMQQKT
jgi:rhodanese-related sulfurtransferase